MNMQIGRFAIDPAQREAFLAFGRDLVARELTAPGCLRCELCEDVLAPNHFLMVVEWEDAAALEQHMDREQFDLDEAQLDRFVIGEPSWDEFEF